MNILYVAHELELNGSGLCLLELVEYFISKGNKVWVLLPKCKKKLNGDLLDVKLKDLGAKVLTIKYTHSWVSVSSKNKYIRFIKHAIRSRVRAFILKYFYIKEKIDIVHTNTSVIDFGAYLARILSSKHVWHFREFMPLLGNKFLFPERDIKFINTNSDAIIFVSKKLSYYYAGQINSNLMHVIYDGVDISQETKTFNKDKTNLLITGYLSKVKNQETAIYALSELYKRGCSKVFLYIAGTGEGEEKDNLIELVEKLNLKEKVFFCGYVKDMKKLRSIIDIELICSNTEGFGRCTVEAMASGIPVIGSDSVFSATQELIVNGKSGLLYQKDNVDDLADKIEFLIKNEDMKKQISVEAIKRSTSFTLSENCKAIETLYEKLLNS